MPLLRRPAVAALLIAAAAQLLFSWHLATPSTLVFDETHYVPAARTLLALERPTNTEHPLVAKEMIAAGIALFGDTALGWRALSTVAGAATVLGVFAILWLLFASLRAAALGAFLVVVNQLLYIQARIAMLDVFLGAFVTLAVAAMLWAMRAPPGRAAARWLLGSILLGLATATKWLAAPYVAFAAIAFLVFKREDRWAGLGRVPAIALLGVVSITTYFLTFAPAFFYTEQPLTLAGLLPFQQEMYARQTQVLAAHSYQSSWWTWPLMIRPIWYLYERVDGAMRGILLIGNPAVMWGGLVAVAALAWTGMRDRSAASLGIAALWFGSFAVWPAIPKSIGFYYYYYLPALFLPIALAAASHRFDPKGRWTAGFALAALALFAWFFPILSAAPLANDQAFNHWMWFDSWR